MEAPTNQEVFTIGKLTLNTRTFDVNYDGEYIQLTRKEFDLLQYLMEYNDRPVSKKELVERVWTKDVLENTVEVYIKYLRAKIDERFGVNLIKTRRGFGYRVSE